MTLIQQDNHHLRLPRLETMLNGISEAVVLFEAPAGFGKTYQGRIWAEKIAGKNKHTVSWFAQKQHDKLTSLAELLCQPSETFHWVFIDEAHLVDKAILLKLADLVIHHTSNTRLVLMQRYNSKLRLATHRLVGNAVLIDKEVLAFTQDETRRFLKCSKTKSVDIHRQFQGWPAAIIHMGSQQSNKPSGSIDIDMENMTVFWEMIEEDVLSTLDQNSFQSFIGLSTLTPFDTKHAQNILDVSQDELAVLIRQLAPIWIGSNTNGYILPCAREGLSRIGWARDSGRMKQLHMKACQYFWAKGELVTALEHASKSGQTEYVCELIEEAGGLFLWLNEGLESIQQAMSFTDAKLCEAYPRLMLIKALLHVKEGKLAEAHNCWNSARQTSQGFTKDRDGGDIKALQDESRVMGSLLAGYGCHSLEEQIATAQPTPKETDTVGRTEALKGYLHTIMCLHALQNGRFEDVRRQAALSETAFEKWGSEYGVLYLDFHRGGAAYGEANLSLAQECYDRAERRRRRLFAEDDGLKFIGKVFAAELNCETGSFLSVRRKLTRLRQQLKGSEAWFDVYAAAIRSQAYLIYLSQGYKDAVTFLYHVGQEANVRGLKRVQHYSDMLRLELSGRANDIGEAHRLAKKLNLEETLKNKKNLQYLMWREYVSAVIAQSLYMDMTGNSQLAKPYLEGLIYYGQTNGNRVCELYGLATFSMLFAERIDALAAMIKETGFILPLTLSSRLRMAFKITKNHAELTEQANTLISKLHPSIKDHFTQREHEIIRNLAKGLADKEIAVQLDVSVHTVRFHMKNIFKKTGESDRGSATAEAERIILKNSR